MSEQQNETENNNESIDSDVDRGLPSTSSHRRSSAGASTIKKIKVGVGVASVAFIILVLNSLLSGDDDGSNNRPPSNSNTEVANRLGPTPVRPSMPPLPGGSIIPPSGEGLIQTGQIVPPLQAILLDDDTPTPQDRKLLSRTLAFASPSNSAPISPVATTPSSALPDGLEGFLGAPTAADGLAARLSATTVDGASAGILQSPSFFITQGTFLDCVLETAISSDVPGMTSCRLTRDVYSTDAKVLLLERGSKVIGEYQSGIRQGQARIFVLWTRVETPTGVIVSLDSPGADSLGRSGLSGHIDTHFWDRFGGALLLSLVDDVGTFAASTAASGNNTQIQFGGLSDFTQNAASVALENSINIPPTLTKNQGEAINIYVARDLDFRGVYELKTTGVF